MNKKTKYNLIGLATAVLLIALDQWTKALAVKHLMNQHLSNSTYKSHPIAQAILL